MFVCLFFDFLRKTFFDVREPSVRSIWTIRPRADLGRHRYSIAHRQVEAKQTTYTLLHLHMYVEKPH